MPIRSRGTAENPPNRFERLALDLAPGEATGNPNTVFLVDPSRQIVATNQSPDLGFDASVNPYRGCEHGCVYCYARPTHEYLGWSAGLDFETRILVKTRAPALLRQALAAPGWTPQVVAFSGVTDPYQPVESRLRLTRGCLEVLAEFRNPVSVITKSRLVARDCDVLGELARHHAASVSVSLTSLDGRLHRIMEPRASNAAGRLEAIERLAKAGVPTGVMIGPVIPGLTDHEIPALLSAAADAGASFAGHIMLRLPHGVARLFENWLEDHFPDRREKVMNRVREMRDGRVNDSRFGSRMRGAGIFADQIHDLFALTCRRHGLTESAPTLSTASFRSPATAQLGLFETVEVHTEN